MALPAVIQWLVETIGHGPTMALVREFGGQELRIPCADGNDTWAALVEVIGERAMKKLAAAVSVAKCEIYIAKCERALKQDRNRQIIARYEKMLRDGHSGRGAVSMLVREFKLSYRQIENIVNASLPEPSNVTLQAQLF